MRTRNSIKIALTVFLTVLAILSACAEADIVQPSGINPATAAPWVPGDKYRLVFITSTDQAAESSDINHYNSLMQGVADAAGLGEATWKVIGSTNTVDARDNTSTNPEEDGVGCPILLIDGSTVVANNNADLWDGEIQHIINLTETGEIRTGWPLTGTYLNGLKAPGNGEGSSFSALGGGGEIQQGRSDITTEWIWRTWTGSPSARAMYAMSDPLIVGGYDPNLPGVDAGDNRITWSGGAVTLDPDVVNNDTQIPQGNLLYAWTASPSAGVVFTPNANVEAPLVTITKAAAAGDANEFTLTLAVTLEGQRTESDTMTIYVYDDSCQAGKSIGSVAIGASDFNGSCFTDFDDFAVLAAAWLVDYDFADLLMLIESWLDGEVLTSPVIASVTVPDVTGDTESEAQSILTGLGLTTSSTYRYDLDIPLNEVISQSPVAGTEVPDGINVSLVVSKGPAPVTKPMIAKVYLAQTHVLRPNDALFKLVGNRPTLLKVQVLGPNGTASPPVTAALSVGDDSTTLTLNGPAALVDSFEAALGKVEHRHDDSFTVLIPLEWIRPGLNIRVTAGNDTVTHDIKVGAPTVVKMKMFDVHYFGLGNANYPAGTFEELEAKWPVSDLSVERVRGIDFPELVMLARDGAPFVRVSSTQDYTNQTGLGFDGEQTAAHQWIGALVASGGSYDIAMHYINIIGVGAGGDADDFKGVGVVSLGILNHELGHALSLPHWGDSGLYPYKGEMYGIEPQPGSYMGTHVGPTWGFDLPSLTFIPPTVQENSVGGEVGYYKKSPMQGGGVGDQEVGFLFRHFSDYGVNRMQTYLEGKVAVRRDGNYYKWNEQDGDYTTSLANDGVRYPIEQDVQVISVMAATTLADMNVNMVYPPIGPYEGNLILTFDPTDAADRALADNVFCPDGGCDFTLRVMQGGQQKTYMLPASGTAGDDPYSNSSLKTTAVNLRASDGAVTQVELLLTPNAEKVGLPGSPDVLYTWTD